MTLSIFEMTDSNVTNLNFLKRNVPQYKVNNSSHLSDIMRILKTTIAKLDIKQFKYFMRKYLKYNKKRDDSCQHRTGDRATSSHTR